MSYPVSMSEGGRKVLNAFLSATNQAELSPDDFLQVIYIEDCVIRYNPSRVGSIAKKVYAKFDQWDEERQQRGRQSSYLWGAINTALKNDKSQLADHIDGRFTEIYLYLTNNYYLVDFTVTELRNIHVVSRYATLEEIKDAHKEVQSALPNVTFLGRRVLYAQAIRRKQIEDNQKYTAKAMPGAMVSPTTVGIETTDWKKLLV